MNFELWLSENESLLWKLARTYQIPGMDCEDVMQELRLVCWEAMDAGERCKTVHLRMYGCQDSNERTVSKQSSKKKSGRWSG